MPHGPPVPPPPPPPPAPGVGVPAAPGGVNDTDRRLAAALIAGLSPSSIGIRGQGFLDLRGTEGGATHRVERHVGITRTLGAFPYWTIAIGQRPTMLAGGPIVAIANATNPYPGNMTPQGLVPFVITVAGELRIGPPFRQIAVAGFGNVGVNHANISQMAPMVAFAGEITFGMVGPGPAPGVVMSWTNDSGGYRCSGLDATRVGLPMPLYQGTPTAQPRDRIDTYAQGRGSRIDWGASGPPPSADRGFYWRV